MYGIIFLLVAMAADARSRGDLATKFSPLQQNEFKK